MLTNVHISELEKLIIEPIAVMPGSSILGCSMMSLTWRSRYSTWQPARMSATSAGDPSAPSKGTTSRYRAVRNRKSLYRPCWARVRSYSIAPHRL